MKSLHDNQKKILDALLNEPEGRTLEQLSALLGVTKTATKAHILKLEYLEHITHKDIKGFVGRPKRVYQLTESGQEIFPKQYAWVSIMLLEYLVETHSRQEVSSIMEKLADKVIDSLSNRFTATMSTAERFKEISTILNELGYRSTLKQSDIRKGAIIEATNCVYHSVAKKHPELCQFDTRLISRMSGMKTRLESCIAKGHSVCRFCLKNR